MVHAVLAELAELAGVRLALEEVRVEHPQVDDHEERQRERYQEEPDPAENRSHEDEHQPDDGDVDGGRDEPRPLTAAGAADLGQHAQAEEPGDGHQEKRREAEEREGDVGHVDHLFE